MGRANRLREAAPGVELRPKARRKLERLEQRERERAGRGVGEPIAPTERRKRASGLTEIYFADAAATAAATDQPLVVFHHIQKTAGTALRTMIRKTLPPYHRATGKVHEFAWQP